MLYAHVVLGLPLEGPFDYIVPQGLHKKIKIGSRVRVDFGRRRLIGYVVGLSLKTKIKKLKYISELIDESALLDTEALLLAKELSEYYCCSWGEAIETCLPEGLRRGRKILNAGVWQGAACHSKEGGPGEAFMVYALERSQRWGIYLKQIKETLDAGRGVIILLPSVRGVFKAKEIINSEFKVEPALLYRKQHRELEEWLKIKQGKNKLVLGTRSAVFAPLADLGLLIIDEEDSQAYKQDQVPHYHARQVAFMRVGFAQQAKLILGGASFSLETFYLAKKNKITRLPVSSEKKYPEVKIIDTRYSARLFLGKVPVLPKIAADAIFSALNSKGRALLFLNRRGFATSASCQSCGHALKCQRCNINLVYHFKENILSCHYCNFKMPAPNLCPNCNAGYMHYRGTGVEKIESELSRVFPQARIKVIEGEKPLDSSEADIFISTQAVIQGPDLDFNLIVALGLDNSLNRPDFRSAEKVFSLLNGLLSLGAQKLIIATHLVNHYCFQALLNQDSGLFYREELKQRKMLMLPPYRHIGLVKVRSKSKDRAQESANKFFDNLSRRSKKDKGVEVVSVNSSQPEKLRGNFYWQVLVKSADAVKLSRFLKICLKDFSHSGIIITVDIDPV